MTEPQLVAIELTDEERRFMVLALNEYGGSAKHACQLLCPVFDQSNEDEWYQLTTRLREATRNNEPL
jgi:hypothetical protein